MTASLLLDNLGAWSAQICVLAAMGALAAVTLRHPRGRLIFWQGILGIALLLPAIEPWTQPAPDAGGRVRVVTGPMTIAGTNSVTHRFTWRREYLLGLLAAGSALRALWIAAGLLRLRRHRLDARKLADPPVTFNRPNVRWYLSDSVSGPVTFGWLRPSILLPARLTGLPSDLREAVASHELVHVCRRDWLFVLAEELIRCAFWFHPAIWLVLSRIQLAREQVVDLEVVRLTGDRTRYLEALVAVAAQKLSPDVLPAPLFLKKRQLAARVTAVLKETTMSKSRLVASFATVCSAALIAVRLAIWLFPLQSPAQSVPEFVDSVVADGPGITVDPGAKLVHRTQVLYPNGTTATGTVVLEASLNSNGEVSDARVLSGPDELRKAALQSVLEWHYSSDPAPPPSVRIAITFSEAPAVPRARPQQPIAGDSVGYTVAIGPYGIGGDVSAPVLIHRVEAKYSEEARQAKWGGTVGLTVIIDENGKVKNARVVQALGLGLDEMAIQAVSQWVFRPGMKDGKPVPVIARVNVTFHPNQ